MKKIHKHAEKSCGACYNNLYAREGRPGWKPRNGRRGRLRRLLEQPGTFLKWVLFAGVIGLVAGRGKLRLYYALNAVTALRGGQPVASVAPAPGGVAIVLLYRICGMEKDRGTNFVLVAVRENQPLRLRTAPLIFAATVLTHLLGGSSGREGAILQIGGSLSSKIGRWMRLDDKDSRIITMCGMSAAFSRPLRHSADRRHVRHGGDQCGRALLRRHRALRPLRHYRPVGGPALRRAAHRLLPRGCPTLPPSPFSSASAWGSSSPCFPSCSAG